MGNNEDAIESLRTAVQRRAFWLISLPVEPLFDPLRTDARFEHRVTPSTLAGGHGLHERVYALTALDKLEVAQHIANHESPRTTKLYDPRQGEISLDEVERIAI